jgi:negative regulator of sigma-B (phosphoserine phosphatase)
VDAAAINQGELIEWGVAARPLPGEARSGDAHVIEPFPGGVLVAAVDGLGHGSEAADAAEAATDILMRNADEPPVNLVRRCHQGLWGTRGAAISLASFTESNRTISWLGVGNVDASLIRHGRGSRTVRESLILRGGVVGYRLPILRPSVISVARGDVLVLATDGIAGYSLNEHRTMDPPLSVAEHILANFARETDDALVLVARYRGMDG